MSDTPETGSGMADPQKMREAWLEFVRPAADRGKLEKIPTRKALTQKDRDTARTQNYWLSKKSFAGWGPNYDRIRWGKHA